MNMIVSDQIIIGLPNMKNQNHCGSAALKEARVGEAAAVRKTLQVAWATCPSEAGEAGVDSTSSSSPCTFGKKMWAQFCQFIDCVN